MNNVMKKQTKLALFGVLCALTSGQLWASQFDQTLGAERPLDRNATQEVKKEFVEHVTGHEKRLIELKVTPEEHVFLLCVLSITKIKNFIPLFTHESKGCFIDIFKHFFFKTIL